MSYIIKLRDTLGNTLNMLLKGTFWTWAFITWLMVQKYIDIGGMEYVLFTLGILGIKTWKSVEKIKRSIK